MSKGLIERCRDRWACGFWLSKINSTRRTR